MYRCRTRNSMACTYRFVDLLPFLKPFIDDIAYRWKHSPLSPKETHRTSRSYNTMRRARLSRQIAMTPKRKRLAMSSRSLTVTITHIEPASYHTRGVHFLACHPQGCPASPTVQSSKVYSSSSLGLFLRNIPQSQSYQSQCSVLTQSPTTLV